MQLNQQQANGGGRGRRWAMILAGGEGQRMRQFIASWLGEARPKQFCTFLGDRSLLQHALDRAAQVVGPERIVTVIGKGQTQWLPSSIGGTLPGTVIEQPTDQGTVAGLLAGLGYILEQDPDATVMVLPSDLFVDSEPKLLGYLRRALAAAVEQPSRLVLLGAAPDQPETDYGWIMPGGALPLRPGEPACDVLRFVEKPDVSTAVDLLKQGALWNTMVLAAAGRTLWALVEKAMPVTARRFMEYRLLLQAGAWPGRRARCESGWIDMNHAALRHVYSGLKPADFSARVLGVLGEGQALVIPMTDVEWTDWGRPERVESSLRRAGLAGAATLGRALASLLCDAEMLDRN